MALMLMSLSAVYGQGVISGTVVEPDGQPAIGATVQVQGEKLGTATNMDGQFTITVPDGKKLVFSYVGMTTQVLTPRNGMKVTLLPDQTLVVDEVVVTGMQKMDKRLFTGSSTKLSGADTKMDGVNPGSPSVRATCLPSSPRDLDADLAMLAVLRQLTYRVILQSASSISLGTLLP